MVLIHLNRIGDRDNTYFRWKQHFSRKTFVFYLTNTNITLNTIQYLNGKTSANYLYFIES